MFVFELPEDLYSSHRFVINFPTKRHWKGKSKIEDIQLGLEALVVEVIKRKISSIAIPPLGCGLGGLDWAEVKPLIQKAFSSVPSANVILYEPMGAPDSNEMVNRTKKPNMTIGRAALLGLMKRYIQGLMDTDISLLELHKLMYFMQEAGEPLRLRFTKGTYGPFASNLGNVLSHIENHFITGYGDGGDNPQKPIEYLPEAVKEAEDFLLAHSSTKERFNRVEDLIQGFESPYGMELLSTIHWLCKYEGAKTVEDVIDKIPKWSSRKAKIIEERHVKIAWEVLHKKGWL
jgi:O-acetyl-ADP-ribose deacetylase (regulator of RNase III)